MVLRADTVSTDPGAFDTPEMALTRSRLPYLVEVIVVDQSGDERWVTHGDLAAWGVGADRAFDTAFANLGELAAATLDSFGPDTSGNTVSWTSDDGSEYASALPLFDGWLGRVQARSGTRPVIFIPDRNAVFVIAGPGPHVLKRLVNLMTFTYVESGQPVSPVPYTLGDDGTLVPYAVSHEHPARRAIHHARIRLAVDVYKRQTKWLLGTDCVEYVPSVMRVRPGDDSDFTLTTWTNDIPSLLPLADVVGFVDFRSDDVFQVGWADLVAHVRMDPVLGFVPPRFRVESHPPEDVMAKLRASAFSPE